MARGRKLKTLEDLFKRCEIVNECWNWTGCIHKGYGYTRFDGKVQTVHRLSYKLHNPKEDISNKDIRHICDNPRCCNPDHLVSGTTQENMDDRHNRHRTFRKLSDEDINEIKMMYNHSKVSMRKLAKWYNVSHQFISMVLSNKRRTKEFK